MAVHGDRDDDAPLSAARPSILSLDDLRVDLPPDIRRHLASQYEPLFSRAAASPPLSPSTSGKAAERHLDRILDATKRPPSETCCRVNLLRTTVEEARVGLDAALETWRERRNAARGGSIGGGAKRPRRRDGTAEGEEQETEGMADDSNPADEDNGVDGDDEMLARPSGVLPDVLLVGRPGARASTADALRGPPAESSVDPSSSEAPPREVFPSWTKRSERGWPEAHRALIVDRLCGEAVLRGSDVFVRGVLVADAGIAAGEDVAVYAHLSAAVPPRGLLLEKYGGKCVFLGVGAARCGRADMFRLPRGLAVDMSAVSTAGGGIGVGVGPDLPPLNGVLEADVMLQNLPSALVAHALDPRPGEVVLDMCSAPGGKACHAASLMRNEGLIVACDKSRRKVASMREKFATMGATCVVPLALDSTKCVMKDGSPWRSPQEIIDSATAKKKDGLLDVKAFHPNSFDRILLDPPCSALGLRPKLRVELRNLAELRKHADYQRRFAGEAVALLKPGGTLTWSTCTIDAAENEAMVSYICGEFPEMEVVPIGGYDGLGREGLPGHGLDEAERGMVRRFDPCDDGDTMGFFVAKFVKKRSKSQVNFFRRVIMQHIFRKDAFS